MKTLFVASECIPFIKTGGLADVIGSLPKQLKQQGVDVRVIIPCYDGIPASYKEEMELVYEGTVPVGWRNQYVGVKKLIVEEIPFYFIDNEYYFKREGLYGYYDDGERFAYFNRAVLEVLPSLDFQPNIIHCHDWQASLIPLFLRSHYEHWFFYENTKTVFTIHNLKYQGIFSKEVLFELLGLSEEYFQVDQIEFFGNVNYLKSGLVYADKITTVSETYANEIQQPYYGEKLEELLKMRKADLSGIINGIDYLSYDPMHDEAISHPYRNSRIKKQKNKLELQQELGLPMSEETPLIAIVTRLVEQKGLDLIVHILPDLLQRDVQLVVLGNGDYKYEQFFREVATEHSNKVAALITFDDRLARRMYASSDLFLMPSRFEPCGIGQLIALRYCSAPIVRETGGLKDTIIPFDDETCEGNGFSFTNYNAHDMLFTIDRAISLYENKEAWRALLNNMRKSDFSWEKSAQTYILLYESLVNN